MSRSKIISSVDIGSTKITTLVGQYFLEEDQINVIGVSSARARGIRKGQIVDIEEATESVSRSVEGAERMAGLPIKEAIVGITAPHVTSLNSSGVVAVADPKGEITPLDVERVIEAARAISLPGTSEILHVIPRHFTVDGQEGILDPTGMTGVRLEVETNIIISSLPAMRNLTRCLTDVGLSIGGLVYAGLATGEAILTETEKELGVILIDVGGGVTSLTIYTENFPCFVRVLPVGADNVTNDLAIGLRLSLEEAEKLKTFLSQDQGKNKEEKGKRAKDIDKQKEEKDEFSLKKAGIIQEEEKRISRLSTTDGIIKPRLDEIFSLLKEEIRESGFGGATPAGVVLTGGGSYLVGIKRSCQQVLGLPVRIGSPKPVSGLGDEIASPAYASAIGLINYAVKTGQGVGSKKRPLPGLSMLKGIKLGGVFKKILQTIKPLLP
ncbi:cell division protein FtsA [Candidatus Shapirobacteria bacterium]|nr:cell division protein FtsA [Candidatus Shapirobacteria bacterium]